MKLTINGNPGHQLLLRKANKQNHNMLILYLDLEIKEKKQKETILLTAL